MSKSQPARRTAPGRSTGSRRARTPPGFPVDAYPPQAYPPGYPVPTLAPSGPARRLAVASLVSALLGITVLWLIGGILALYFGYRARNQIVENGQRGQRMAMAGIVIGWAGIAASGVLLAFWLLSPYSAR